MAESPPSAQGAPEARGEPVTIVPPDPARGSAGLDPRDTYRSRAAAFSRASAETDRKAARIASARLLVFSTAVVCFFAADAAGFGTGRVLRVTGLLLALPFFGLVAAHSRVRRRHALQQKLERANLEGLARIERRWDDISSPLDRGSEYADSGHPYARDLDVVGHASLLRLLSAVATAPGLDRLCRALLGAAPAGDVVSRQSAVAELAARVELREEVAAAGSEGGSLRRERLAMFVDWAESEPWLASRPGLAWTTRVVPAITLLLVVADSLAVIPAPLWIVSGAVGAVLARKHTRTLHDRFDRAGMTAEEHRSIAVLAGVLVNGDVEAPELLRMQAACRGEDGAAAPRALSGLRRILDLAEVRRSGLFHLPLHWVGLWDFHVLAALERWQRIHGRSVRGWLDAIGELDALCALGTLAFEHPDWSYPTVSAEEPGFRAEGLGHPLLPPEDAVPNDLEIAGAGTFVFVTGSNMSGKSTLLRSIGLNAVLAMAGAPVFAREMSLRPVRVWTSMRIADDLERGVSQFLAEVARVGRIVGAARDGGPEAAPVLFLLDEILQGTNTEERRAAARRVIRLLLAEGGLGAVTSHDLALVDVDDLREKSLPVHLRESVSPGDEGPALEFDYRLRPGVATSTNALRILELMGLGPDPDEPGAPESAGRG